MFSNSLYNLHRTSGPDGEISFEIKVDSGHPVYAGHFPGQPVTPGVVLCEIVKELLESHLNRSLDMSEMRQCKFLSAHNPLTDPDVTITVKWTEADGRFGVQAVGLTKSDTLFKLSVTYAVARKIS